MVRLTILGITLLVSFAVSGCASRYAGPVIAGGVVGYVIGKELSREPTTRIVYQNSAGRIVEEYIVVITDHCRAFVTRNERDSCERGAQQRATEERRKQEREAYKHGYGR